MAQQIPMDFPVQESYAPQDFMALPCNEAALAWVNRFPDWPYPAVILYGEQGCGKTHLLHVWQSLAGSSHNAIDNVDNVFGDDEKERELFHRFNRAKEEKSYLLLSMTNNIGHYDIHLPDLASRLRAAPQIEISPPGDADLQAILVKLFHDRQLRVEPGVIAYILPRIERSFAAARDLVRQIDALALSEKRSVTVPLVRAVLCDNV